MKLKFKVFASGEHTFHSKKTDRDIRQARLIGSVFDAVGEEIPGVADLGFDGRLDVAPSPGEIYLLDCLKYETENAMAKITFSSLESLPQKVR